MGFFNFVENFFLISLGITFVLILLLVYHFKQRVSSMERKGDTMFELMRNMVNEINILKRVNSYFGNTTPEPPPMPTQIPIQSLTNVSVNVTHVQDVSNVHYDSESVYDSDEEDDDQCTESNDAINPDDADDIYSVDSSDDEADAEDDTLDEIVDEPHVHQLVVEEIEIVEPSNNVEYLEDLEVDDFEHLGESFPDNIQEVDTQHIMIHSEEYLPEEIIIRQHLPEENIVVELDNIEHIEHSVSELPEEEKEPESIETISVEVKEEPVDLGDSSSRNISSEEETTKKDSYRKMNLHQLKSVVHALGIQADVSKMKKNEILKLLNVQ